MDSLTLFGHLFKTRCEAICIFLDFFTEKRGSHREIYDFFRKNHEMHCICKRCSIYCNKNCSGNMQILCSFAETTYTPSGDENLVRVDVIPANSGNNLHPVRGRKHGRVCSLLNTLRNNLHPVRGRKLRRCELSARRTCGNNLHPVRGRKLRNGVSRPSNHVETTYTPSGDENSLISSFCQRS